MCMYSGPCYPDYPSTEELSAVEVGAQIHKVLDLGVNPNSRAGYVPLRRGVTNARVSTLGPVSAASTILSFQCAHDPTQGLGDSRGEPQDANLPEDTAKREAKCASDEEAWVWRERERERGRCATRQAEKRKVLKKP
jgi:hypothetical protein